MRRQKGFSLIELLIVVAIILIIAAIAIPNLLRARISANEAAAVSTLRTINTAEVSYVTNYAGVGYSPTLAALGGAAATCVGAGAAPTSTAACLLDDTLATTAATTGKSGYTFVYAIAGPGYTVTADALKQGTSGVRGFFTDESGVIRAKNPGPTATVANDAVQ